jgi:hypothetical protein
MEIIKKNFGSFFFTTWSDIHAAQLLIETDKSNKDENKIILSKLMMAHVIRKSNMKSKFFLQISDHQ